MTGLRNARHGAGALAIAGLLAAGAAGCSSDDIAEQAIEQAADAAGGDVDIDQEGESFSVDTGDGEGFSVESTDEVPAEVADLVPIPDGFAVESVTDTQMGEDGDGTSVQGQIDTDDPKAVLDEIEAALADDGFETQTNSDIGGEMFTLMMTKEGEASVTISIIVEDEAEPAVMNLMVLRPAS